MKLGLLFSILLLCPLTQTFSAEMPDFFGSFRYRYERIDQDGSEIRNRQRIKSLII